MEVGTTSGKYTGNGTSQSIPFSTDWKNLTITSSDRKYIMSYFKGDGQTIGQAAIGSGGTFKQLTVLVGGITANDDGYSVGNHISINETGVIYYWSVN